MFITTNKKSFSAIVLNSRQDIKTLHKGQGRHNH